MEGIEKLRPGHWLEWRGGAIRTECYWQLPFRPEHRQDDPRAAQEELDRLLKQSVAEHLLADVPLGIWLSGGIDSSTMLHYAAEASAAPAANLFHFIPRAQLRRDPLHPRGREAATAPSTTSWI